MKKHICWLLIVLLLLAGCTGKTETKEEKVVEAPVEGQNIGLYQAEQGETVIDALPGFDAPVEQKEEPAATELPAAPEQTAEPAKVSGYDAFVRTLSAAVIDGKGTKNLSPISVYLAVAMAAEGARGETQAEMLALLGAESIEDLRLSAARMMLALQANDRTGELTLANSIWLGQQDATVSFHQAYLDVLAQSYDAQAEAVPFGDAAAAERIAAWIREKTKDKIEISEDALKFDTQTLAVLINTIYLKDVWRTPFDQDYTEQGAFQSPAGEMQVKYMRRTDAASTIVRGEGYLRYAMALSEVGRMVFVLPDEGVSLESLLGSPEKLGELLHGGTEHDAEVDVKLPKFTFQDRTDLEETLQQLGVQICFTADADFSAMTDAPAYVSRVLQESRIGVDENGVEAAAYTMMAVAKNAAFPSEHEKVDFHLTRPFLYAIESRDGTVLFVGTVTAPDKA